MFERISTFYRAEIQYKSGIRIRQTKEAILGLVGIAFVAASVTQLTDTPKYLDFGHATYLNAQKTGETISFSDVIHPKVRNDLIGAGFYSVVAVLFGLAIYDSRRTRASVYRDNFVDNWAGMEPWTHINKLDMIRAAIADRPVCSVHQKEVIRETVPLDVASNPYSISEN